MSKPANRPDPMVAARDVMQRARDAGASTVLVGLSGGKDSIATLDLCCEVFPRVEAYYMYLVKGIRCVESQVEAIAGHYNVKLHKIPHWQLSRYMRSATFMPPQARKVPRLALADIEAALRIRAGLPEAWFAYGQRADESLERRAMLSVCKAVDTKTRRMYPLQFWSAKGVLAYIAIKRLPAPVRLTGKKNMDGFDLTAPIMQLLRSKYPDDYRRVLEVFPYVSTTIFREKQQAASAQAASKAQAGPG